MEDAVPNPAGVLAIFTGKVVWQTWIEFKDALRSQDADLKVERLLDARAYSNDREFRVYRSAMGQQFTCRLIKDEDYAPDEMLDDGHLLDIDENRGSGRNYVAIGGGPYTLPEENARKVCVRNYFSYDEENGMARFVDFRIVGIETEGQ